MQTREGKGELVMCNHLVTEHASRTRAAANVHAGMHTNGWEGLGGRYQHECRNVDAGVRGISRGGM